MYASPPNLYAETTTLTVMTSGGEVFGRSLGGGGAHDGISVLGKAETPQPFLSAPENTEEALPAGGEEAVTRTARAGPSPVVFCDSGLS